MKGVYAEIVEGLTLEKGKKFPIGTVRTHGGVKKKKTAQGWVAVEPTKGKKKSPTKKKKKAPAKKKKAPAKRKGTSLAEKIDKTAQEMLEPGRSEEHHENKEYYHRHKRGDFAYDSIEHDYHSSMMMYHDNLANAKNYLRAAQDESFDQADMLKEAKSYLRDAKKMKKYAEEEKAQMGKAQIQELKMEKGKKYPIGTVRTHGGVKKKKTAQGWVPVGPAKGIVSGR